MSRPPTPVQPGERVAVTGANGFIGSYVVQQLLEQGFTVRAVVRDPSNPDKTAHLLAMDPGPGADGSPRLELARGNLMEAGSFDAAFDGCAAVVHTAAAVVFSASDPQRDIVDPSVVGTRNVLVSCAASPTVRRVVHTSSMVAVYGWSQPPSHVYTEADWNTSSTLVNDPYGVAKVEAERAARRYVDGLPEDQRFRLVHLNPGMVWGPPMIKAHAKASPKLVRDMISRAQPGVPKLMLSIVDVRDVATAHLRALTHADPPPRCLILAENAWMTELMAKIQAMWPELRMGPRPIPKPLVLVAAAFDKTLSARQLWHLIGRRMWMDNARSRAVYGLDYLPLDQTLRDTAAPMIEHGWARVTRR